MKKYIILFMVVLFSGALLAQPVNVEDEVNAIKKVIQSAYIDGLQNLGNMDDIKKGFHPGFDLLIQNKSNSLEKLPIYTWLEMNEQKRKDNPNGLPPEKKVTCQYDFIDVTGTAAVAKFKFLVGGVHIFTDYISLYKFNDGWKIVGKIYYRHPEQK